MRLNVGAKIGGGFGLIILLILLMVGYSYVSLREAKHSLVQIQQANERMALADETTIVYKDAISLIRNYVAYGDESLVAKVPESLEKILVTEKKLLETARPDKKAMVQGVIADTTRYRDIVINEFMPAAAAKLQLYKGERPIFDLYSIDEEIALALGRRVQLKSGGYLIVDQTEALTTIDVNTGGYVGARNFDDTIFKTNLEAAQAIARQLRLRNLGGIIIVDFIDMVREDHQQAVLSEFKKQLARDRVKTMSSGTFSQLGLVEMTRKRTRESLAHMLCEPCEACQGKGSVKTARSVCYDILREILREARQFNPREFRVVASARVVELFLDEESQHLAGLSDFIGKPISLQAESAMGQEQYDIVLL